MVKPSAKDTLKVIAKATDIFLRRHRPVYALNQPTQLSVKGRTPAHSTYRMEPFVGEEEIRLAGCFVEGNKVWVVGQPTAPAKDIAFIRIELSRAKELFDGLDRNLEEWAAENDDQDMAMTRMKVEDLEVRAALDEHLEGARNAELFGTW